MSDLKPCPFCGDTESLFPAYHQPVGGKPYAIDCVRCGMDFTPREGIDVVEAWNRRDPALAAKDAEIAKLREALTEAFQTMTGEDACNIAPILGSDNPHEHAAGLVRAALKEKADPIKAFDELLSGPTFTDLAREVGHD